MGGKDVELRPIDADHFWYGDVMVDLPALRYERDSLNAANAGAAWNAGGREIHDRNSAIGWLNHIAERLAAGYPVRETDRVYTTKSLREANENGLHTGIKFD